MESWRSTLLVEQVFFNPQKRLIQCEAGVDKLFTEQSYFDKYLNAFRKEKDGQETMDILKQTQVRANLGSRASIRGSDAVSARGRASELRNSMKSTTFNQ